MVVNGNLTVKQLKEQHDKVQDILKRNNLKPNQVVLYFTVAKGTTSGADILVVEVFRKKDALRVE